MRDLLAGVLAGAAPVRIERAHAQARVGLHRVEDALTQLERQGLGDSVRARGSPYVTGTAEAGGPTKGPAREAPSAGRRDGVHPRD